MFIFVVVCQELWSRVFFWSHRFVIDDDVSGNVNVVFVKVAHSIISLTPYFDGAIHCHSVNGEECFWAKQQFLCLWAVQYPLNPKYLMRSFNKQQTEKKWWKMKRRTWIEDELLKDIEYQSTTEVLDIFQHLLELFEMGSHKLAIFFWEK
jgi:hypothetical protein